MASTSSDTLPIPVFSGDKYDHWRVKMKIFLKCHGLWEFVDPGYNVPAEEANEENRKKNATALSYIQQGVSDDQFDRIIEATMAKEAWDILEKAFDGDDKENDNVTETTSSNVHHESTSNQPMISHPPPGAGPMPAGYHNYPVVPFQCTPWYPNYHSQQPFFYYPQPPPGYPTFSPPYQHGGSFGPPRPMLSSGGGLVGALGRVANKVEQISGQKITGTSTGQQMGHPLLHPVSGIPPSQPPPTLPLIASPRPEGAESVSFPPPEGGAQPLAVTPQMTNQNSKHTSSIISQQFVSSQPINLTICRKMFVPGEGNFDITDSNGNTLFTVKGKIFSLHDKRTMFDAFGNPLVTFCSKSMSMHDKWVAYRGNRTRIGKLFTAKRSSFAMLQVKASLDVTLEDNENTNKSSKRCDYKVKGSWFSKSFTVHSVATNSIVAEMSAKLNLQSILFDRETYVVTVYPNIDYAFISSLLVIFDGIVEDDKGGRGPSKYSMLLQR